MRPLLALAVVALSVADATAVKPTPCPLGRFVVVGSPLIPPAQPNRQQISVTATDVSIGACAPTAVVMKARRRNTLIRAKWPKGACGFHRATLTARIDAATCTKMTGRFVSASLAYHNYPSPRRFIATRAENVTTCSQGLSTFDAIQRRILGSHGCAVRTCHGVEAAGGLNLVPDAYDALVGVAAANPAAAAAGLKRVTPGAPADSFLVRKLRGTLAGGEGDRMPRVGTAISAEEIALIEAWITAGAPHTGQVGGAPCLPPLEYVPVAAPDPPPGGYQLLLDGPTLQPGQEVEGCTWVPTPNASDFVVGRWEFTLNPGTHHFAVFRWEKDGVPPLGKWDTKDPGCIDGAMFGDTLSGAPQAPYFADALPAGVARVLPAGGYLGLNAHYANDFDEPIQIKVWANVYPYAGTPDHIVQTLTDFDEMFAIDVPPRTQKLQTGRMTNIFPTPLSIVQLVGHMHKRGLRFTARDARGTTLINDLDWAHPFWTPFTPPLVLAPGDYIDYECLEDNGVTRPLHLDESGRPSDVRFGLTTDDEMCTLTAAYYTP